MEPDWVRLRLDVSAFDDARFAPVIRRCEADGIVFTTMSELGDNGSNRRKLYDLNRTCSADIPDRGEFYTYEEYLEQRIHRDYTPDLTVIALDGDAWVGMSSASERSAEGYYFNEMTGVIGSHRGRGIAMAMKAVLVQVVRDRGGAEIRTVHHPNNAAPIALNRHLGYVDA